MRQGEPAIAVAPDTILQVIGTLAPGGAERVVIDLCRHLNKQRFRAVLCHLYPPSDLSATPEAEGLEIVGPLAARRKDPRLPWKLAGVVQHYAARLVHLHLAPCGMWYTIAHILRLARAPFVYTHHSTYTQLPAYASVSLPYAHRAAAWITCVSEDSARSMVSRFPFTRGRYSVIWNAISPMRVLPRRARKAVRADLGVEVDAPLVCNVANVGPAKGQDTLLRAFEKVHSAHPRSRLLVIGDTAGYPAVTQRLRVLVSAYGLEGCVQFLGRRADVPDLLWASDIAVVASRWEGLPISILEAMAAGRPVVTTSVGGCAEAVVNGETGIVVPTDDTAALADALRYLFDRPDQGRRMGAAGQERVSRHFTVSTMARQYEEIYLRAVAGASDSVWRDSPGKAGPGHDSRGPLLSG